MSTDANQLKLRISKALRGKLEKSAKRIGLTLNAESIRRLVQSFICEDSGK